MYSIIVKCFALCKIKPEACYNNLFFTFGCLHFATNLKKVESSRMLSESDLKSFREYEELLCAKSLNDKDSNLADNVNLGYSRKEA